MTKKQIKKLKKQIYLDGALSVGYYDGFLSAILSYDVNLLHAAYGACEGLGMYLNGCQNEATFNNILVDEIIKIMKYSEFKNFTQYFFQ